MARSYDYIPQLLPFPVVFRTVNTKRIFLRLLYYIDDLVLATSLDFNWQILVRFCLLNFLQPSCYICIVANSMHQCDIAFNKSGTAFGITCPINPNMHQFLLWLVKFISQVISKRINQRDLHPNFLFIPYVFEIFKFIFCILIIV